jgi:hypothetical protein
MSKRERVQQVAQSIERKDELGQGGETVLDPKYYAKNDMFQNKSFMVGRFMPKDKEFDTYLKARRELVDQSDKAAAGKTPYGVLTVGDDVIHGIMRKKETEEYMRFLGLGEALIDPDDPRTYERAYAILPELREVPDAWFKEQLALCIALRTLLMQGEIKGPDDHALVLRICHPDFLLPITPLWDPSGMVIKKLAESKDTFDALVKLWSNKDIEKGYFSPRNFGHSLGDDAVLKIQHEIKKAIVNRLYPGVKKGVINVAAFLDGVDKGKDYNIRTTSDAIVKNDYGKTGLWNFFGRGDNFNVDPDRAA